MSRLAFVFTSFLLLIGNSAAAADIPLPRDSAMAKLDFVGALEYWDRQALVDVVQEALTEEYDREKIVLFGDMTFRMLKGSVDARKAQAYVNQIKPGLQVKIREDGKTPVTVQYFRAQYVIGCACPPAFSDLLVSVEVGAPAGYADKGVKHVVPVFNITTHEERRASFHTKFGSPTRTGTVGPITDRGFFAVSIEGERVFTATAAESLPGISFANTAVVDTGVHTIGGIFRNWDGDSWSITPRFYRKAGVIAYGARAFDAAAGDTIELPAGTDLAKILGTANLAFTPETWINATLAPNTNAKVWLP